MQPKQVLTMAVAVIFSSPLAAALTHGEVGTYDGKSIRWQQLAEGVFTGVNEDEWDDSHHKRSNVEWDVDEIAVRSTIPTHFNSPFLDSRDMTVEARDLQRVCNTASSCVVRSANWALYQGFSTWFQLAAYAANGTPGKDLMTFLNQPFVANAAGVAIAGTISGQINEATKTECSTEPPANAEADIVRAAVQGFTQNQPDVQQLAVEVTGPSGTFSVKMKAGEPETTPEFSC